MPKDTFRDYLYILPVTYYIIYLEMKSKNTPEDIIKEFIINTYLKNENRLN